MKALTPSGANTKKLKILAWALLGTIIAILPTTYAVTQSPKTPFEVIFAPAEQAPTKPVFEQDFPDWNFPKDLANQHDGTQFYVMARNPLDMSGEGAQLDRPQYRWQRPLHAWLAWSLHPTGGGYGLLWSLMVVTILGVFAGAVAAGLISQHWKGPAWVSFVYPIIPGAIMSIRLGIADALAASLILWGIYFITKKKLWWAAFFFSLSVLAKEVSLIPIAGLAASLIFAPHKSEGKPSKKILDIKKRVQNNWKQTAIILGTPTLVIFLWWRLVKLVVPVGQILNSDPGISAPFAGIIESIQLWQHTPQSIAIFSWLAAFTPSVILFIKSGFNHPFSWSIYLSLVSTIFMSRVVLALDMNASRILIIPTILGLIALLTPDATWPQFIKQQGKTTTKTITSDREQPHT